ncbi:MAG: DUF2231 domain-containing protein, partial [Bacteroidota bacterium]
MDTLFLASMGEFIGRFHPLLVHLPIGFLLLTIALSWLNKEEKFNHLISWAWLLSSISALFTVIAGWLLANHGSYEENTLFWHRWLGVGIVCIAFLGWWIGKNASQPNQTIVRLLSFSAVGLLIVGGHLGGNLTHGPTYVLEKAPRAIQQLAGYEEETFTEYPRYYHPDSTLVFEDLISPILEKKCVACHNDNVTRGGLNVTTQELLLSGGDNGEVIIPGNAS